MNILLVNWQDRMNPQSGGAEIHLHEIFGRLAARGHRVRLVCSGWAGGETRAMVDGMEVHRTGNRNSFTLLGRGAVRRALKAERPDVVVEDVNKVPLFLAGMTDRPFGVIVPHLFGSTIFQEASLPSALLVWAMEQPLPWAYRRAGFHAISESTRDDLIERGVPAGRITVIYPGVDARAFTPDATVPRTAYPSFVYVGRLRRYKGVEFALRAVAIARAKRPDIRLRIAGRGDDQARLVALAKELGQEEAVEFLGFVSEAEKMRLFRSSWANIFPSPKEGWGITNVEAAACGTPSLASNSPGLRDSVRDGQTGYLVPHANAESLAGKMLALAEDPGLVARLGQQARAFAESLSWDRAADETEAWLAGLVEE
ncbi:MAG TPA: glycosyltransferase family 4 protein [Gemmatimonadales bacterium]|nr:glycosyltransferase family 4 protein [Gemmatimonadales bacterium]